MRPGRGEPGSGPHPQRDPIKTPPRSEHPSSIPGRSPLARITKASSGQFLEKPPSPLPTSPGGLQPPLGRGCPRQVGALRRVLRCTPRSCKAAAAGAPTRRGRGAAGGSPWLRRSRCWLSPTALSSLSPPWSALRASPARRASFDPIAPTQWLSPPCWAAAARSALQPPSPRRSGTQNRGAPSLRRGYLGWIAPGAAAAAAGAAGPPPSWPRQGRSANSQLWRGRARRVHTRPGHGRDTPRVLS